MDEPDEKLEAFEKDGQDRRGFMIWGGACFEGRKKLHLVKRGAKIKSEYYVNNILKPFLKTDEKKLFPDRDYFSQQDSAPSHDSKATICFMNQNLPFIPPSDWPSKSPNLSPMDFFVWNALKRILNTIEFSDMASFRRALKRAWRRIPQGQINRAFQAWPRRVKGVLAANGGHIEKFRKKSLKLNSN